MRRARAKNLAYVAMMTAGMVGSSSCHGKKLGIGGGGGGGGTADDPTAAAKAQSEQDQTGAADHAFTPGALALATSLDILPAKGTGGASLNLADVLGQYAKDVKTAQFHTRDPSMEVFDTISQILCMLSAGRYADPQLVGTGAYIAQFDETECNGHDGSSSSNGPQIVDMTVKSDKADDGSTVANLWFVDPSDHQPQFIQARIVVGEDAQSKADTANENLMRVMFVLSPSDGKGASGAAFGHGALSIVKSRTDANKAGVVFTFNMSKPDGGTEDGYAAANLTLADNKPVAGTFAVQQDHVGGGSNGDTSSEHADVVGAYNSDLFHSKGTSSQSGLADTAPQETCKDLNNYTLNTWRYGVYDGSTGDLLARRGGFPLRFTKSDGTVGHAYAGNWGLSTQDGQPLDSGLTVTMDNGGGSGTPQTFTVVSGPGKLMKHSRVEAQLDDLDGVPLNGWDMTGSHIIAYNKTKGIFEVTGNMTQGDKGMMTITPVSPATPFTLHPGVNQFWMQGSPGQMVVGADDKGKAISAYYMRDEDVTGTAGNLALSCVSNCPGQVDQTVVDAYAKMMSNSGPMSGPMPSWTVDASVKAPVAYTYDQASMTLKNSAGKAIGLKDGVTYPAKSNPFAPGVMFQSGLLVTADVLATIQAHPPVLPTCGGATGGSMSLADSTSTSSGTSSGTSTGTMDGGSGSGGCNMGDMGPSSDPAFGQVVTYSWQFGQDGWNRFQGLKAGDGSLVVFDPPVDMPYKHTAAFDASHQTSSPFFDKTIHLQWDGSNLQGIPGDQDPNTGYWVPKFSIASGAVAGDHGQYVIAALGGDKYMNNLSLDACAPVPLDGAPAKPADAYVEAQANTATAPDASGLVIKVNNRKLVGDDAQP